MKSRTTMTIVIMGDEAEVGKFVAGVQQGIAAVRTEGLLAIEQNDVRVEPIRRKRKEKVAE